MLAVTRTQFHYTASDVLQFPIARFCTDLGYLVHNAMQRESTPYREVGIYCKALNAHRLGDRVHRIIDPMPLVYTKTLLV